MPTRFTMFGILFALMNCASAAEAEAGDRLRLPPSQTEQQSIKPPRGATSNPCAQFGAGFVRVEGSDSCIKIGGSTSVGTTLGTRR